jgi:hypothetical protein
MVAQLTVFAASIVDAAFESLFYGSGWYFGILLFITFSIGLMKAWKYAGALIIPIIVAFEVTYYQRLDTNPEFAWNMFVLLFLVIGIAVYTVTSMKKKGD